MKNKLKKIAIILTLFITASISYVLKNSKSNDRFFTCKIFKGKNVYVCNCTENCKKTKNSDKECDCYCEYCSQAKNNLSKYELIGEVMLNKNDYSLGLNSIDYAEIDYRGKPWIGFYLYYVFYNEENQIVRSYIASDALPEMIFPVFVTVENIEKSDLFYIFDCEIGIKDKKIYDELQKIKSKIKDLKLDKFWYDNLKEVKLQGDI